MFFVDSFFSAFLIQSSILIYTGVDSEPRYFTEGPILGRSKLNKKPLRSLTTELSVVASHSSIPCSLLYCAAALSSPTETVAGALGPFALAN